MKTPDDIDDSDLDEFGLGYEARGGAKAPPPPSASTPPASPQASPQDPNDFLGSQQLADLRAKLEQRAANNAPAIPQLRRGRQPDSAQLGFNADIAPGATVTVSSTGYTGFKPTKFIINESVPGATEITGMFMGVTNALYGLTGPGQCVPSSSFNNGFGSAISYPMINPGIPMSITVRNKSNVPVSWNAALFGPCLR